MKTCSKCRKKFDRRQAKCPHCGKPAKPAPGLFQTSAVLISSGGADLVYRSVDEVPAPLRNKLLQSTNGQNSATIVIADRRGREEVAKAVRAIPASAQARLRHSFLSNRNWLLLLLTALLAAAIVFACMRHWR